MHADELDVTAPLVRAIVAEQFPEWAGLPVEPVEPRGTDNRLYRVGDELVARLPCREGTVATLVREREWLPELAPHLPLEVPAPVAIGEPDDGYPWTWSIYRWLDGSNAAAAPIVDRLRCARDLARFLRALRAIDASHGPPSGEANFLRGAPLALLDARVRISIAALGDAVDADGLTAAWEEAAAAPKWEGRPVWIHGDLDARNLLVRDGRVTAVVDWGCVGVGDPAVDVAVAWKVLSGEARAEFRRALVVDDATWARARGWVVYQAAGALSYYTEETNAALVIEARRWLSQLELA